jgi:hypothetical protein
MVVGPVAARMVGGRVVAATITRLILVHSDSD